MGGVWPGKVEPGLVQQGKIWSWACGAIGRHTALKMRPLRVWVRVPPRPSHYQVERGSVRPDKIWRFITMPKSRPSHDIWFEHHRPLVYERDLGRCQGPYCLDKPPFSLSLDDAHVDHIRPGKLAGNEPSNLRLLCTYCHALRADRWHSGLRPWAIRLGIIPANWRPLAWDEDDLRKLKAGGVLVNSDDEHAPALNL